MKKYSYPKSFFERIIENLFGKNIYLTSGSLVLLILIIGYSFVTINSNKNHSYLHYRIDLNNRLKDPAILNWNSKIDKKISNYENSDKNLNEEDELNSIDDYDAVISNNSVEEVSKDDFLFLENEPVQDETNKLFDSVPDLNNSQINLEPPKEILQSNLTGKVYLFGTNSEGRDIFTNLFLGLEIYIIGGILALFVALLLGTILGSLIAYSETSVLSKIAKFLEDIISSFPKIVILFIALIVYDIGLYPIMVSIGILSSTKISKALFQKIIYLKKHEFIDSAKQIGLSDLNILIRHILFYNCRDIFIVYSIYILADTILLESTLAYLNFGIEWTSIFNSLSVKSWGTYLAEGKSYISNGAYWITLFPALFIILLILSLNFIGDGLKEKYHIK